MLGTHVQPTHPRIQPQPVWIGLVLLCLSMAAAAVLQMNRDAYALAKASTVTRGEAGHEGTLVSATGPITASPGIGDGAFVQRGPYVALRRMVETYAWTERSDPTPADADAVVYVKAWMTEPPDSRTFRRPDGHLNPPAQVLPAAYTAANASVRGLHFAPADAELPSYEALSTFDLTTASGTGRADELHLAGGYAYLDRLSIVAPRIGDARMRWEVIPCAVTVTIFGYQRGDRLAPHKGIDSTGRLTVFPGTRRDALRALHQARAKTMFAAEQVHLISAGLGAAILVMALLGGIRWPDQQPWVRWVIAVPASAGATAVTVWWAFDSAMAAWLSPAAWIGLALLLCWWIGHRPESSQTESPDQAWADRADSGEPLLVVDPKN